MKTPLFIAASIASLSLIQSARAGEYIAHEWGTFTSVQGPEGEQLPWNPLIAADLPDFVFSEANPTGRRTGIQLPSARFVGKSGTASLFATRQRMETPVIYFYAEKGQKVDVGVQFNGGRITEWYPQIAENKVLAGRADYTHTVKWSAVELLPGLDVGGLLPKGGRESHYYAARETDAVPLRVTANGGVAQTEKMLFYRGVGSFTAPLNVRQPSPNTVSLQVSEPGVRLSSAFLYVVHGDRALLQPLGAISGEPKAVTYDFEEAGPLAEVRAVFGGKLRSALVADGLYEKEAEAMVKTWDDSWFAEPGMRVLYTLPKAWADRVLPLTFSPVPKAVKRVFVGRAELFTNAQEWAMVKAVVRYSEGDEAAKAAAVKTTLGLGLGRFADTVMRRVYGRLPMLPETAQATFGLLEAMRPKENAPGWSAAR